MPHVYRQIAFSPSVRSAQVDRNSRHAAEADEPGALLNTELTQSEAVFLARCQSLFLASTASTGWPYVQHRGGPAGFVKILDPKLIGWAEYAGNQHFITTGNLADNERVSLIAMDYARKARLKLFGRARLIDKTDAQMDILTGGAARTRIEHGLLIQVEGYDWNCSQHIPPLFSPDQVEAASEKMLRRIAELEKTLEDRGITPPPLT